MTFLVWRHDCIWLAKLYFVRLLKSHSTYADYICKSELSSCQCSGKYDDTRYDGGVVDGKKNVNNHLVKTNAAGKRGRLCLSRFEDDNHYDNTAITAGG